MISITDYESADRWLAEVQKDTDDFDLRHQFEDLQAVLEREHEGNEKAGHTETLREALRDIEELARDTRLV